MFRAWRYLQFPFSDISFITPNFLWSWSILFYIHFVFFFCLFVFRATVGHIDGSSKARGWIGASATGLCHSHGNTRSLTHWAGPGFKPTSSWKLVGFITAEPQRERLFFFFIFNLCLYNKNRFLIAANSWISVSIHLKNLSFNQMSIPFISNKTGFKSIVLLFVFYFSISSFFFLPFFIFLVWNWVFVMIPFYFLSWLIRDNMLWPVFRGYLGCLQYTFLT